MQVRSLRQWAIVSAVTLIAGCAGNQRVMMADIELQSTAIELVDTPFYPQITDQCGPSALATILNVAGVDVSPLRLKSNIYIPGRQGSLQLEMLAATRSYERVPYILEAGISAVFSELEAGRPVLVLQNLGTDNRPVWHYAVVVGFLPGEKTFVLRSGDQERYRIKAAKFLRSWRRAGYWAMVALQPGTVPDRANPEMYLSALAAFESTGNDAATIAAYVAAVAKWPENTLAGLGLGNAYYADGQLVAAQQAYAAVLRVDPQNALILNNLAQVLHASGSNSEAAETIAVALSLADVDSREYWLILQTQQEISQPGNKPPQ